jgi:hypothetical protein
MEAGTEAGLQPGLHTETLIPGDTFKNRIDQPHHQRGSRQLRIKTSALRNTPGNNGGYRSSKGQQEEKFHQLKTAFLGEYFRTAEKMNAVGNAVADKEISDRRHSEID